MHIIPTAYPDLMSDAGARHIKLGFGKDYITYAGCLLYATAHAVSSATGVYINPLTPNNDASFFLPNSSSSDRSRVFTYARSKGLIPDYWTKNIAEHIEELSSDKNTGYTITAQLDITHPNRRGPDTSGPHWVGINGTSKDGLWGIVVPSSQNDLKKYDRLGNSWRVDKNGTAYIKISAIKEINDFKRNTPSLTNDKNVDAVAGASPTLKQNPIVSFFTNFFGEKK